MKLFPNHIIAVDYSIQFIRKKKWMIGFSIKIQRTIMIGDREHDVLGAQAQKLDSIGVLYGFGSREELEEAGATYIAQEVGEIAAFIG